MNIHEYQAELLVYDNDSLVILLKQNDIRIRCDKEFDNVCKLFILELQVRMILKYQSKEKKSPIWNCQVCSRENRNQFHILNKLLGREFTSC